MSPYLVGRGAAGGKSGDVVPADLSVDSPPHLHWASCIEQQEHDKKGPSPNPVFFLSLKDHLCGKEKLQNFKSRQ